nr:GNAT family N-acetyltransferase [uncultured Clostridium sp.]
MDNDNIRITNVLTRVQKKQVARLYYEAFTKKFHALWIFTKDRSKAAEVLFESLRYNNGLYAVKEERVLGFIGLEKGADYFSPLYYSSFCKVFSPIDALWRYLAYQIYRLFHRPAAKDVLHIDPIVVSEQARSKGIGSSLLSRTFELAKKIGRKQVVLEVVDTNPQAKKLYERHGFRVVKEENTGLLTKRAGFKKVYYMVKDIS